ncbi:hypothetical protein [Lysinibacillus piscis]|uniref:Uncharacterized protein n=1 Tax=Lysinibacillus piscis TaxID=2518931 RepID=A0ABQ5NGR5_9BACI|nr:hypothetical protein [Lysinibacillus sp. KH24]GLC87470.1 hypothetical protein LYSBPC_05970 [Lysinibacillus sp. KH24]
MKKIIATTATVLCLATFILSSVPASTASASYGPWPGCGQFPCYENI